MVRMIHEMPELELVSAIDAPNSPALGRDAGELAGVGAIGKALSADLALIAEADVVVDFSLPQAIDALLAAVVRLSRPLVLATTGLKDSHWAQVDEAARRVPLAPGAAVRRRTVA